VATFSASDDAISLIRDTDDDDDVYVYIKSAFFFTSSGKKMERFENAKREKRKTRARFT